MTDAVNPKDQVRQKIEELTTLQTTLKSARLARNQTLAARVASVEQKRAMADLDAAKGSVAISGTLVALAEEIDFGRCALERSALRGALLDILAGAKEPEVVARYHRLNAEFQSRKRRTTFGLRGFVAVARPSEEMKEACKRLKLRYNGLAGGFEGRAGLDDLVDMGLNYKCTVRLDVDKELIELVGNGVVDDALLARLRSGAEADMSLLDVQTRPMDSLEDQGDNAASESPETPETASGTTGLEKQQVPGSGKEAPGTGFVRPAFGSIASVTRGSGKDESVG